MGVNANMTTQKATDKTVRELISKRFTDEQHERVTVDIIRDVIATFEGKQLNRRVLTKIKAALGDAIGTMEPNSGNGFTFFFWGGATGRSFDNRLLLFLNSESRHAFASIKERFELSNPAYYVGLDERQGQRVRALTSNLPQAYAVAVE